MVEIFDNKKELTKVDKNLEAFMQKVDFELLKSIFREEFERMGVFVDIDERFVGPENISSFSFLDNLVKLYNVGGKYTVDRKNENQGVIKISDAYARILDTITKDDAVPKKFDPVLLGVLCHEETHAVMYNNYSAWERETWLLDTSIEQLGLATCKAHKHRLFKVREISEALFVAINEGITDLFSEKIYNQYTKKTNQEEFSVPYIVAYKSARRLVDSFVAKIAGECSMDKKEVFNVVVKASALGSNLLNQKVLRLFGKALPEDFWKNVSKASARNIPLLISYINSSQWSEQDKTRLCRWMVGFLKKEVRNVG